TNSGTCTRIDSSLRGRSRPSSAQRSMSAPRAATSSARASRSNYRSSPKHGVELGEQAADLGAAHDQGREEAQDAIARLDGEDAALAKALHGGSGRSVHLNAEHEAEATHLRDRLRVRGLGLMFGIEMHGP